jgi:hypothetical protein
MPNNTPNVFPMLPLFNLLVIKLHEKSETILIEGDLWIPIALISPHHKIRCFFHGIEFFLL